MKFSADPAENAFSLKRDDLQVGWCMVSDLKKESFLNGDLDHGLPFAVSLAFPLLNSVIDSIIEKPNKIYQQHYRSVNNFLNQEALTLSSQIQKSGFDACPVPVSVSVEPLRGHLSHRMAAMLSGLGWIGRSSLLITPEYFARVRLVTILTDLPLPQPEKLLENNCGDCGKCRDICPVKAIQDDAHDIKREVCFKYLDSLLDRGIVEEHICGLCVKVCQGGD